MAQKMSPVLVQDLVTKAFVLEVLADKPGCTTRFVDLPDRPLEDFVIAGINSAPYFKKFAADRLSGSSELYEYFIPALKASNVHKSAKYINLGLLEIMFDVVAARLNCDKPTEVIRQINLELKRAARADARVLVDVREIGWKTSRNPRKQEILKLMKMADVDSPYGLKEWLIASTPPDSASFQWGTQAVNDWPILAELFERLRASKKERLLDKIADAYVPVAKANKEVKVGILADMTAAAIFLHLSFL